MIVEDTVPAAPPIPTANDIAIGDGFKLASNHYVVTAKGPVVSVTCLETMVGTTFALATAVEPRHLKVVATAVA